MRRRARRNPAHELRVRYKSDGLETLSVLHEQQQVAWLDVLPLLNRRTFRQLPLVRVSVAARAPDGAWWSVLGEDEGLGVVEWTAARCRPLGPGSWQDCAIAEVLDAIGPMVDRLLELRAQRLSALEGNRTYTLPEWP